MSDTSTPLVVTFTQMARRAAPGNSPHTFWRRWSLGQLCLFLAALSLLLSACASPDRDNDGVTVRDGDCNDANDSIYPGGQEQCDDLDHDCDGQNYNGLDDTDQDDDGYKVCQSDCDDGDATTYPGAEETCNGVDDDCDGTADEGLSTDADGDGRTTMGSCLGTRDDCDDQNAAINPDAEELCNDGLDNDCDGLSCLLTGDIDLSQADAKLIGENEGDYAGYSVSSAGDVDGDGFDDLIIGAYSEDSGGGDAGAAYLIYGGNARLSGSISLAQADARFTGEAVWDFAGISVSSAGDVDGDGYDDLLIGALNANGDDSGYWVGAAYLIYGGSARLSGSISLAQANAKFNGESSSGFAGISVSSAGDMDGDGYDDLLIGAYGEDSEGSYTGAAYLLYGGSTRLYGSISLAQADARFTGESSGDKVGWSVSSAGDVDGDGFDDLIIGANREDSGGSDAGAAYLLYGGSTRLSGSISLAQADAKFTGESSEDYAGISVSSAGDMDGDGFDDLLIGAYAEDSRGTNAGAAYLLYGGSVRLTGSISLAQADAKFTGESNEDYAGYSVSSAGDVDGDGLDDLLIGAYQADSGESDAGIAYLIYGGSTRLSGSVSLAQADAKFTGEISEDYAGSSVASAGDVDGDGFDDLIIGAYAEDSGGTDAGAAYVVFGLGF